MKEQELIDKIFNLTYLKEHDTDKLTFYHVGKSRQNLRKIKFIYKEEKYEFTTQFEKNVKLSFLEKHDAKTDEEREAYSLVYTHLREILKKHPLLKIPLVLGLNFEVGEDENAHPFRITDFSFYEKTKEETFVKSLAKEVLKAINETKEACKRDRPMNKPRKVYFYGTPGKLLIKELEKLDDSISLGKTPGGSHIYLSGKTEPSIRFFMEIKNDVYFQQNFAFQLLKKLKEMGISCGVYSISY